MASGSPRAAGLFLTGSTEDACPNRPCGPAGPPSWRSSPSSPRSVRSSAFRSRCAVHAAGAGGAPGRPRSRTLARRRKPGSLHRCRPARAAGFRDRRGPGYVLTPTFGFLVGFVFAAAIVGLVAGDPARSGTFRVALALALGIVAIYLVGVPWLAWNFVFYQHQPLPAALLWKLTAVFLPLDLLKAALLLPVIRVVKSRGGLVPGR